MVRDGRRLKKRLRLATHMLPAFHTIGICVHLMTPMHGGSEVALYPPLVKVCSFSQFEIDTLILR